jgi:hypothetical protein
VGTILNKGAVDLFNNWIIGGRTSYVDIKQCFLRELKESKVMDTCWIKGWKNDADAFTKHLDAPAFEKCIKTLVGQYVHIKNSPSCEHVLSGKLRMTYWLLTEEERRK